MLSQLSGALRSPALRQRAPLSAARSESTIRPPSPVFGPGRKPENRTLLEVENRENRKPEKPVTAGAATMAFTGAQRVLTEVKSMLPRIVTSGVVIHAEPVLYVDPPHIPAIMEFLKGHSELRCKQLVDMTAVDVPSRDKRFEVLSPSLACAEKPCCLWSARC